MTIIFSNKGFGDSGKSTLLKHLSYMYKKLPENDELGICNDIYKENIKQSILYLDMYYPLNLTKKLSHYDGDEVSMEELLEITKKENFYENYEKVFYSKNSSISLHSRSSLNKIVERCSIKEKTSLDCLQGRIRTTGIIELKFDIGEKKLQVVDVGGSRNEKRKWIHCFVKMNFIFYCINLTHFFKNTYGDYEDNAMEESVALLENYLDSKFLCEKKFVLFFTHLDQFGYDLKKRPTEFLKFVGVDLDPEKLSVEECVELIYQKFVKKDIKIEHYSLNLLDPKQMRSCFDSFLKNNITNNLIEPPYFKNLMTDCVSEWSVEDHKYFPSLFKQNIIFFLYSLKLKGLKIPKYILFHIIKSSY